MTLTIEVLGPIRAVRPDGRIVAFPSVGQRRLVAALAVRAAGVAPAEWLADALGLQAGALRTSVSRLRKLLGEQAVVTEVPGYRLGPVRVDAAWFEQRLSDARTQPDERARRAAVDQALTLWHGEAFEEFAHEEWIRAEAVRLDELRTGAVEELIALHTAVGDHAAAIGQASILADRHPYRDRPRALLMSALFASGRRAEALRVFHDYRRLLLDELGTDPSADLVALDRRIATEGVDSVASDRQRRDPAGLPDEPGVTAGAAPDQLSPAPAGKTWTAPLRLSSFVGRRHELAELERLVAGHRLVTVWGTGGAGKTTIAERLAAETGARYSDGVWWLELDRLPPDAAVELEFASALAAVIGVGDAAAPEPVSGRNAVGAATPVDHAALDAVIRRLGTDEALVVFDNCEHVLLSAAATAKRVLQSCPNVRILATSRVPLQIPGERTWLLPSLPFEVHSGGAEPGAADAVRLFADRAAAARPGFEIDQSNAAVVLEICRVLEGIPLALEFAAARVRVLDPTSILAGLSDALRMLRSTGAQPDHRHRSIEASITWSVELLSASQRAMLERLAVFAGPFDLEAVSAVVDDGLAPERWLVDDLQRLVEHSLVAVTPGDPPSFVLAETVRQFGARALAAGDGTAAEQTRDRHARHFAAVATIEGPRCEGADELEAVARLDSLRPDLRAALTHLGATDVAAFATMVRDLAPYWTMTGASAEGRRWLDEAINAVEGNHPAVARLHAGRSMMRANLGDYAGSVDDARRAIETADALDDGWAQGRGLWRLADVAGYGDIARWEPLVSKAVDACRQSGDAHGLAYLHIWLAVPHLTRGHIEIGAPLLDAAAPQVAELGNPTVRASFAAWTLWTAYHRGELDRVEAMGDRLLDGHGFRLGSQRVFVERLMSGAALYRGAPDPIGERLPAAAERAERAGESLAAVLAEDWAAQRLVFLDPEAAAAQALRVLERSQGRFAPAECTANLALAWAAVHAGDPVSAERFLAACDARGAVARWPLHRAPWLTVRALVLVLTGETAAAVVCADEAVELTRREGLALDHLDALETAAVARAAAGHHALAAELAATAGIARSGHGLLGRPLPLATLLDRMVVAVG